MKKEKKCGSKFGRTVDNVHTKMPLQGEWGEESTFKTDEKKRRICIFSLIGRYNVQGKQINKEIKRDPGYITDDFMYLYLNEAMLYRSIAKANSICFQFYILSCFCLFTLKQVLCYYCEYSSCC